MYCAVCIDHGDENCEESKNPHPGILTGSFLNLVLQANYQRTPDDS